MPALLGFLAACGAESPLPAAHRALARGRLEQADALLAKESGREAVALRMQIREMQARREEVRADLDALLASHETSRSALLATLRGMLAGEEDPVVREWIESGLSRVADRAPARRERAEAAAASGDPPEPRASDAVPPAESPVRDPEPTDHKTGS